MKKTVVTLALASLSATSAYAGGPADKVTGDFIRATELSGRVYECEFTAHEAMGNRDKKGSMYCNRTDVQPDWWEIDLGKAKACVNVGLDEGTAIIGGLVDNAEGNSLLGKFVVFKVFDGGEPGGSVDRMWVNSQFSEADFWAYCNGTKALTINEYYVEEGNIQVHDFDADGD